MPKLNELHRAGGGLKDTSAQPPGVYKQLLAGVRELAEQLLQKARDLGREAPTGAARAFLSTETDAPVVPKVPACAGQEGCLYSTMLQLESRKHIALFCCGSHLLCSHHCSPVLSDGCDCEFVSLVPCMLRYLARVLAVIDSC